MIITLFIIALVFFSDQWIKESMEGSKYSDIPLSFGSFAMKKTHNAGMIMNTLQDHPKAVKIISSAAFALAFFLCLPIMLEKGNLPGKIASGLFLGGALSNVYDHLKRGYVVDYLYFPKHGKLSDVVFNIGDFAVFFGAVFLCFWEIFRR